MEKTILGALPSLFQSLGTAGDPAAEFYNTFQRAADDHDNGFVKKYDEDLNSTLIFVSIFPAHRRRRRELCIGDRLVYSPRSQALSLSTFNGSLNRISRK